MASTAPRLGSTPLQISPEIRANPLANPLPRPTVKGVLIAILVGGVSVWAWRGTGITLAALVDGWPAMVDFVSRLFPPNWSAARGAVQPMLQTVQMAIVGTLLATILAVPL